MAYNPFTSSDTHLYYSEASVWVEITNILSLDGPTGMIDELPATTLADTCHVFLPGLLDVGPFSGSCIYDADLYAVFEGLRGVIKPWRIEFKDGLLVEVSGYVSKTECPFAPDELQVINFEIRTTGCMTTTVPS